MRLAERLLTLLYPKKCVFCGKLLRSGEEYFCRACGEKLPMCEGSDEIREIKNGKFCIAPLFYEGVVRSSLLRYKFSGASYYAPIYAELIFPYIARHINEAIAAVTWVPISKKRHRSRGYDQSELVAKRLAQMLGVPCVRLAEKITDNPPQSGISNPEQRRANVLGAYSFCGGERWRGKCVLIVDDIVTTGSTLSECCRVISENGVGPLYAIAVAKRRKVAK